MARKLASETICGLLPILLFVALLLISELFSSHRVWNCLPVIRRKSCSGLFKQSQSHMKRQKSLPLLTQFGFKQQRKKILLFLIKYTVTAKATFWAWKSPDYTLEHRDVQNCPGGRPPGPPLQEEETSFRTLPMCRRPALALLQP